MSCTNCALALEKYLQKEGYSDAQVDFASSEAAFTLPKQVEFEEVVQVVKRAGYTAHPIAAGALHSPHTAEQPAPNYALWVALGLTAPLLLGMLPGLEVLMNPLLQLGLSLPVVGLGVYHFGRGAWAGLRSGVGNMDLLVLTGTLAAFGYSLYTAWPHLVGEHTAAHPHLYFETAASIVSLVMLGHHLEHRALHRTRASLRELLEAQPLKAKRLVAYPDTANVQICDAEALLPGDVVLLNSGDRVPADALILSGQPSLDESLLTGESEAIAKLAGDRLLGGSLLVSGNAIAQVQAVGAESTLGQLVELMRKAQGQKPALQRLSDRVSAIFVPAVLGVAALTFSLGYWAFALPLERAVLNAVAVLVVACPCAMGLAIPTAVVVGIGRAARMGVLIKSAEVFEQGTRIKTVVFDKTGTLTTGRFELERMEMLTGDVAEDEAKAALVALESRSNHPLAQGLLRALGSIAPAPLSGIEEHKGKGLTGTDPDGNVWAVGNARLAPEDAALPHGANLYVFRNNLPVMAVWMWDEVRSGTPDALAQLRQQGVELVLLSGDLRARCEPLAASLGIKEVWAEQLPHEKLERIKALQAHGGVLMVGDGLNDAPALAQATMGVAIGGASQLSAEAASAVLLRPDLRLVPQLLALARHTNSTLRQNLFWAFFYNVLTIPVAAVGLLSPIIGAATMALSDIVVVGNSLRLRWKRIA
jgi:Cu+-exporting ATPase